MKIQFSVTYIGKIEVPDDINVAEIEEYIKDEIPQLGKLTT